MRLRRRLLPVAVTCLLLLLPALAHAINLMSAGGFLFDITETSTGSMTNGTLDAYDGCYYLDVNGTRYNALAAPATLTMGGRQVEMAEVTMGTLRVRRIVYVPAAGGDWARYLDVVSNPGAAEVPASIVISGNLGSNTATVVTGSSSGDMLVTPADTWFGSDDALDGSGDPSLAHVLQGGPGSLVSATSASISVDNITWRFDVMVPAGGRVAVVTFAIQAMNRATANAEAARVVSLPADALTGLEPFAGDVVNFPIGGAPVVRFTSPPSIDEGEGVTIEATVTDLEGDTPTWSWDLDDDGVFGEMPGATTYVVPPGTTDGDGTLRVSIEATDGTNTRVASRSIAVRNVAPAIASEPPTGAFVRREYVYHVIVDDPAGPLDPLDIRLTSRPPGMEITDGLITWTPTPEARARTFPVIVRVFDGDGGEDAQMWEIAVANNQPPTSPTPLTPIERARVSPDAPVTLTAMNGTDADGDPLLYFFQLSRTSAFTGADVIGSGEVTEGTDGTTSWTTTAPLETGLWYWRVWVSDDIEESRRFNATFVVGSAPMPMADAGPMVEPDAGLIPLPDGGPPPPPPAGGCGCRASGPAPGAAPWLVLALALVARRRRVG